MASSAAKIGDEGHVETLEIEFIYLLQNLLTF
jgi:hypothetical protein